MQISSHRKSILLSWRFFLLLVSITIAGGCGTQVPGTSDQEGLTPEAAAAIAAVSFEIPSDLSGVTIEDTPFDPTGAKTRAPTPDLDSTGAPSISEFWQRVLNEGSRLAGLRLNPNGGRLAYVFGSKKVDKAYPPTPAGCKNDDYCQRSDLYGLDCSGFLSLCVRAGGISDFREGRAVDQSMPENWKIPPEWKWNAEMVSIPTPAKLDDWRTGDIVCFLGKDGAIGHIGFVVKVQGGRYNLPSDAQIWNCLGDPCISCDKNSDPKHGPVAWSLNNYPGGKPTVDYPKIGKVLRLSLKPGAAPTTLLHQVFTAVACPNGYPSGVVCWRDDFGNLPFLGFQASFNPTVAGKIIKITLKGSSSAQRIPAGVLYGFPTPALVASETNPTSSTTALSFVAKETGTINYRYFIGEITTFLTSPSSAGAVGDTITIDVVQWP